MNILQKNSIFYLCLLLVLCTLGLQAQQTASENKTYNPTQHGTTQRPRQNKRRRLSLD